MAVTATTFKTRFPEFNSVTDARVEIFLDDAALILNETNWGDKYDLGVSYYTAHNLFVADQATNGDSGGNAGPITSRSVDGVSVGYASKTNTSIDADMGSTAYGQRYLSLRKSLGVPAYVI